MPRKKRNKITDTSYGPKWLGDISKFTFSKFPGIGKGRYRPKPDMSRKTHGDGSSQA